MRKILCSASLSLLCAAAAAASGPISWGKPHVTYDQYRAEARECSLAGVNAAIDKKETRIMPNGMNDTLDDFLMRNQISAMQTNKLWTDTGYAAIATCLTGLGYQPFRLTDDQAAHLKTLAVGTEARHQYLYSLGIDASVLSQQGISPADTARR